MTRRIGSRKIVFRVVAGILSATGAVMLFVTLVPGGLSWSRVSVWQVVLVIVVFTAVGAYAVLGERFASKPHGNEQSRLSKPLDGEPQTGRAGPEGPARLPEHEPTWELLGQRDGREFLSDVES